MRKLSLFLIFLTSLSCFAESSHDPVVTVTGGDIKGVSDSGVISFKGIPFAAAPVGDLRWMPPQPVVPWKGVRPADHYGFDCMQKPFPGDAAPLGGPISEDCLYLNVWKPAKSAKKPLPVMVWIYGGGFTNGGSSPSVYTGKHFAESGVVFVSFNYRLGRFGFFGHPALTAENSGGLLGNYGYMDQVAALQWVQRNIEQFGGDPDNVTIFGESAGGGSVNTLMTANPKYVSGLFNKAIAQSGGGRKRGWWTTKLRKDPGDTHPSGEDLGVAFAKEKGIDNLGAEGLRKLRALSAEDIVNNMNMASGQPDTYAGPMIDGELVVQTVEEAFKKGDYQKVPYIAGANNYEWAFMVDFMPEMASKIVQGFLDKTGVDEARAIDIFQTQDHKNPRLLMGGIINGDVMFVEPARYVVKTLASQSNPAWLYRFDYVTESEREKVAGAFHATEIPFVFKTIDSRYAELSPNDWHTANAMHNRWVAFAKRGAPALKNDWKKYNPKNPKLFLFGEEQTAFVTDPAKERLDLVEEFVTK